MEESDVKTIALTEKQIEWLDCWLNRRLNLLENNGSIEPEWTMLWEELQHWLDTEKSICTTVQKLGLQGYQVATIGAIGSDGILLFTRLEGTITHIALTFTKSNSIESKQLYLEV